MKLFLYRISTVIILTLILLVSLIFIPFNPRQRDSLYFSVLDKNLLLQKTKGPRIIFVGGSNLSFGLNSQIIKDSLQLNPVNTAIHAHIGMAYMLDLVSKHIKKGDVIVIAPEFNQFFDDFSYGGEELLITATCDNPLNIFKLKPIQLRSIIKFVPGLISKLNIYDYLFYKQSTSDIYARNSFNKYGDASNHWNSKSLKVSPSNYFGINLNTNVRNEFIKFNAKVKAKGAFCFFSFPCIQEKTYNNCINQVREVESEMLKTGIPIISKSDNYKFSDSLIYNSEYHLNYIGVRKRTILLLKDLRKAKIGNNSLINHL